MKKNGREADQYFFAFVEIVGRLYQDRETISSLRDLTYTWTCFRKKSQSSVQALKSLNIFLKPISSIFVTKSTPV